MADKKIEVTAKTVLGNEKLPKTISANITLPVVKAKRIEKSLTADYVPSAEMDVVLTGLGTSTPGQLDPNVYRLFRSPTSLAEQVLLTISPSYEEFLGTLETIDLGVGKNLEENPTISEEFSRVVDYVRFFTASYDWDNEGDAIYGPQDSYFAEDYDQDFDIIAAEAVALHLDKAAFTLATGADDEIQNIQVAKVLNRFAFAGDEQIWLSPGKVVADAASTWDELSFTQEKIISDTLTTTDDFQGEANIDDDVSSTFGKGLLGAVGTNDLLTFSTGATLTDTAEAADDFSFEVAHDFAESSYAIEYFAEDYSAAFWARDTVELTLGKSVSETVQSFIDTLSFNASIVISDTLTTTDDFQGEANIDDDAWSTFGKSLAESTQTQELVSLAFTRTPFSDAASIGSDVVVTQANKNIVDPLSSIVEEGWMNNQNYFAEDYISPGYAGTNYTF